MRVTAARRSLVAPTGELVDGRRLLAEAVGFGRALRAAGLAVDMGAAIDFARALGLVDLGRRDQVHDAGGAMFVHRRDDREVYDRVFAQFWRRRGRKLTPGRPDAPANPDAEREEDGEPGASDEAAEGRDATLAEIARLGVQVARRRRRGRRRWTARRSRPTRTRRARSCGTATSTG